MRDPNRQLVERAAELLSPLSDHLVFAGGCATGLLLSDPASGGVRSTKDVDAIAEVFSYGEYATLSERLRAIGFSEDMESGVICRWRHSDLIPDVMPMSEAVLGVSNRWFASAITSAQTIDLGRHRIRIVDPVHLLATKLEAFRGPRLVRPETQLTRSGDASLAR